MPNYTYKARDEHGKLISGTMNGANKDMVASKLHQSKYMPVLIAEKQETLSKIDDFFKDLTHVKMGDIIAFNIQLSNMIGAGISLPSALLTLTEQIENQKFKSVLITVYNDIKGGSTFSDALKKHGKIFPNLYVNMVKAGEVAGNLDEVLNRLAKFYEHDSELIQKIQTAMFYPTILLVLGIGVMAAIIVSILPAFAKIFIDSNVPLPTPTLILYNLNLFIRAYWKHVMAVIAGLFFTFKWYKGTKKGKLFLDTLLLKIPVIGKLVRQATIARLTRTLASLINSGVPILQSLEITESTIDNGVMSKVIKNVYSSVSKGETMSKPLKESGEFPPMPIQMIAAGEDTGALDKMLNKVADFYDVEAEYSIKRLTTLIEPIFLVVIGGGVGFIFASILLPIFSMIKTIQK